MSVGHNIHAWRLSRKQSVAALASKAGLPSASLEAIEAGEMDPSASALEKLASALGIPPSWLYTDPEHVNLLFDESDEKEAQNRTADPVDPVIDRILLASRYERRLYVLLTALLQNGDPKLLKVAEVNLQSLVKQSRQTLVPWQMRPPGHFEPPSD